MEKNERNQSEKRIKFSLPEVFVLGLVMSAFAASGKAIIDVETLKNSNLEKSVQLDRIEKAINNLDNKFDGKIENIYNFLIREVKSEKIRR